VIEFHRRAGAHAKGGRIKVANAPSAGVLKHAACFSVYRAREMSVAPGERIRLTATLRKSTWMLT
jgi:hypothetical protein